MAAHAMESLQGEPGGVHRGTIIAFDRAGRPLVRAQGLGAPLCCDVLDAGLGVAALRLGDAVAVARYRDPNDAGCILGRIATQPASTSRVRLRLGVLEIDVDELVLNAKSRITLGTERARIRLTEQGDLELLAWTLVSKARRLQKLLAPMLRLN